MFKKYPKIQHPTSKYLDRVRTQHPELDSVTWLKQEKFDGANIQIFFEPGEEPKIGKRSDFVTPEDNFFNVHEVFERQRESIEDFVDTCVPGSDEENVRLYGELIGPGVQNRIDYGDEKRIVIFDVMIADDFMDPEFLEDVRRETSAGIHLVVPAEEAKINTLEDFNNMEIAEGVEGYVLKPSQVVLDKGSGDPIMFKVKNEKFLEKENKNPKPKKKQETMSEEAEELRAQFLSLVNDNRLKSVFSKHGEIDSPEQLGDYIKLVMEDAKEDFFQEYGDQFKNLDKKEQGKVMNIGKEVVPLLKEYL